MMTTTTKHYIDNMMYTHIIQSNLIEGVDDMLAHEESLSAWHRLVEYNEITLNAILELHKNIMSVHLYGRDIGAFRTRNVQVTDNDNSLLPHYLQVPDLMNQWIHDLKNWDLLDPKAMHVRFEKILPFVDGNGRVGRMLMWWHEAQLDRIPTLILNDNKLEYYRWFMDRYI